MLKEFKDFISRGNVMDMAVGVIVGGAFQKIVTSLVNDIIMPFITVLTGKVDFSELVVTIGNSQIKYGNFITTIINFLIVAFSIFIAIRTFNKLNAKTKEIADNNSYLNKAKKDLKKLDKRRKKGKVDIEEVAPEPTTKICPFCYSEINYKATKCPHCTTDLTVEDLTVEKIEKQEI